MPTLFIRCAIQRWMYCPRCERTISKERMERVERELRERFGNDALSRGRCPVCGTPLIDLEERKDEDREDDD